MATKIAPKNIMEDLVEVKLDELMRSAGMCCCERCHADVKALALNKLPPRYVVSTAGEVYSHFQELAAQNQINITTAIVAAIRTVHLNPHHGKKYA
jgi:competence protein ComFB